MNKYWAHKLEDLLNQVDKELAYASGKETDGILEYLLDDVVALTKHKHYPLPKYIVREFTKAIGDYQYNQFMDVDSLINQVLMDKVDRLKAMLDEEQAHEQFLAQCGPLLLKEDEPMRRTQFSQFVDQLVRNGDVEEDVASQWEQPLEFA